MSVNSEISNTNEGNVCSLSGSVTLQLTTFWLLHQCSLGNARFMKTIRGRHKDGLVVVKILIKPKGVSLQKYVKRLQSKCWKGDEQMYLCMSWKVDTSILRLPRWIRCHLHGLQCLHSPKDAWDRWCSIHGTTILIQQLIRSDKVSPWNDNDDRPRRVTHQTRILCHFFLAQDPSWPW
jgi:hypothetical protein